MTTKTEVSEISINSSLPDMVKADGSKSLESQPESNKAALSTPNEIDYLSMAKGIAVMKNGSIQLRQGNWLYCQTCNKVKSMRGINKADRLPGSEAVKIETAIEQLKADVLNKIDGDNLTSYSERPTLHKGEVVNRLSMVGVNKLTWVDQVKACKTAINNIQCDIAKRKFEYKDTESLESNKKRWEQALAWAEKNQAELNRTLTEGELLLKQAKLVGADLQSQATKAEIFKQS